MKTKEVSVTVSRAFNLGNYETLKLSASEVVILEEGDDPAAARQAALEGCRDSLREQYINMHPKAPKAAT